jgi:aspartate 1-decarboxylase
MLVKLFKSKIHRATITESDLHYEGSCSIDSDLMEAAGILQYEAIWVWNINTGSRLMTYALMTQKGSGVICLNGSAARLGHKGDLVIITTFADMTEKEAKRFVPTVVLVNEDNKIKQIIAKSGYTAEEIAYLTREDKAV